MSGINEIFEEGRGSAEVSAFFYLIVSSPRATSVHDAAGELAMFNPSCTSLLGYDPGELSTLAPPHIVHPDDLTNLRDATARARDSGTATTRLRLVHKSDGPFEVDIEMTTVTVDGHPLLVVVSTPVDTDEADAPSAAPSHASL